MAVPSIPPSGVKPPLARKFVKQFASNGFLPVIALEAFVEAGRTYQAYKRGGFDEARERITEEFSGAVFWLTGVTALNTVFEKVGQKILGLPSKTVDIAQDEVRNPLEAYLNKEKTKAGKAISKKTMAKFKFIKVISSVVLTNAFIGFALPKINQAITRRYHRKHPEKYNKQVEAKTLESSKIAEKSATNNVSFNGGMDLLTLANNFENKRNWKLLSVDVGTTSGRTISARNNDERVEIAFRDLASIYFYMFNMYNLNKWLNKLEMGKNSRLDPVSVDFVTKYLSSYLGDDGKVDVKQFEKDVMGIEKELPNNIVKLFNGNKVVTFDEFKNEILKSNLSKDEQSSLLKIADKMSQLQPEKIVNNKLSKVLTEGQVKDSFRGGYINNPDFLKEFYSTTFGKSFMEQYKYVAQKDIDGMKNDLTNYLNTILDFSKEKANGEISNSLLNKVSKKNFKMNSLNWGLGFAISALFLSTIIPKTQYLITKKRTGQNNFPGTVQFNEN